MAGRRSQAGRGGAEPEAGGSRGFGRSRQPRRGGGADRVVGAGASTGENCRARAQDRPTADRPRFFSRSLAACRRAGSQDLRHERRGHRSDDRAGDEGGPSIEHLCALGGVSRAGFYRFGEIRAPRRAEADLRDKIQAIALENRFYGYRRVKQELWLHGLKINRKHVLRSMREDNLLCLRQKSFVPPTTDSRHKFPIVSAWMDLVDRPRSDLGRRHHLRQAGGAVRLSRRRSRRLFAQSRRLGARRPSRGEPRHRGARHGPGRQKA